MLEKSGSEQAEKNKEGRPPRLGYIDPQRPEDHDVNPDMDAAEDREHNRRLLEKIERQAHLTKQQREIYKLKKAGHEGPAIASQVGIEASTVRVHSKGALDAMRRAALELGLLEDPK